MISIKITYVDGEEIECSPEDWQNVRSEGVDTIVVSNPLSINCSSHSLYWFYKENDYWVLGCASTYITKITPEILFIDDKQISREITHIPDLMHKDVKLGWWRLNEDKLLWP